MPKSLGFVSLDRPQRRRSKRQNMLPMSRASVPASQPAVGHLDDSSVARYSLRVRASTAKSAAQLEMDQLGKKSGINGEFRSGMEQQPVNDGVEYKCEWVNSMGVCKRSFISREMLLQHITQDHFRRRKKGYICKWSNCPKRKVTHFISMEALQAHVWNHIPFSRLLGSDDEEDSLDHSSDENYCGSEEKESQSSEDDNTDEFIVPIKRKRTSVKQKVKRRKMNSDNRPPSPAKPDSSSLKTTQRNASSSNNLSSAKPGSKDSKTARNTTEECQDSSVTVDIEDDEPSLLGSFSFTCYWQVQILKKGIPASARAGPLLACQRKFTDFNESVRHLCDHHVRKLPSTSGPWQCSWKGCLARQKFYDVAELKAHVKEHVKDKVVKYNRDVRARPFNRNVVSTGSSVAEKKQSSEVAKPSSDSWMYAALRALLSTNVEPYNGTLCQHEACYFCRFYSLRNLFLEGDESKTSIMNQFTNLMEKFEAFENDPMKFISNFLGVAARHEKSYHEQNMFDVYFWIEDIKESDLINCYSHPMDNDLDKFFSKSYKTCDACKENSESWPSSDKLNLVFGLDKSMHTTFKDAINVKGRMYYLSSVIALNEKSNLFYTHAYVKESWVTYNSDTVRFNRKQDVLETKSPCVVIYSVKCDNIGSDDQCTGNQYLMEGNCMDTLPEEHQSTGEQVDSEDGQATHTSWLQNVASCQSCDRGGKEFHPLYADRKLKNEGKNSCVNPVLQALLATSLPLNMKLICAKERRCYFCRMLSISQRVFCSKLVIEPYELAYFKDDMGLKNNIEGDPRLYIKYLIQRIVADEEIRHHSNDTKYKFMIRFQKNCSCADSKEVYHWSLFPKKKNVFLDDLVSKSSVNCERCGVVLSKAVQMPENLILLVEKQEGYDDASIHYPDEWVTHNLRYFLAAVIVSEDDGSHYSAYCRLFGRWMHYDDEHNSIVADVLGKKNVAVLLYVVNELTPKDIKRALIAAAKLQNTKSQIKKEPTAE